MSEGLFMSQTSEIQLVLTDVFSLVRVCLHISFSHTVPSIFHLFFPSYLCLSHLLFILQNPHPTLILHPTFLIIILGK